MLILKRLDLERIPPVSDCPWAFPNEVKVIKNLLYCISRGKYSSRENAQITFAYLFQTYSLVSIPERAEVVC